MLIFLSHIHEERELAILIKGALEDEFSGFVQVFVSSDGTSIPAGANFLKRIEDGLVDCVAALYLISPKSVNRNWINFELGAVWIRNVISLRSGGKEVPALPVCHSGIEPDKLPAPLNNLNGIQANKSHQLEFAFRSIQSAVGGGGKLRTNFDELAQEISAFEYAYTAGASWVKVFKLVNARPDFFSEFIPQCRKAPSGVKLRIESGMVRMDAIRQIESMAKNELEGALEVSFKDQGFVIGAQSGDMANLTMMVVASEIVKHQATLLNSN